MKTYSVSLTPKELLPEITDDDKKLAEKIQRELKIPLEDISWFIRSFRAEIESGGLVGRIKNEDSNERMIRKEIYEILLGEDIQIETIQITTNKGKIKIPSWFFHYFNDPIPKILSDLEKEIKHQNSIKEWVTRRSILHAIFLYFYEGSSLNKSQILYAVGLIMVHFKLYGYKPLLEEHEFSDDRGATDYRHYLIDIVKRRLAMFLTSYYPKKSDNQCRH